MKYSLIFLFSNSSYKSTLFCASTFDLSTVRTKSANWFWSSIEGKGNCNFPNRYFEMFDIDLAEPFAALSIRLRYKSLLINFHKKILLQLFLVFSLNNKSGIINLIGVDSTYAAIPTSSGVFFLVKSKSLLCTSALSIKSSSFIIALFSSGL